jgi:two-component sensor histidine kinase
MGIARSRLLRLGSGSTEALVFALICVVLATVIGAGLGATREDPLAFAAYYPAVLFATFLGGAAVGSVTALIGGLLGWYLFLPLHFALFPMTAGVAPRLMGFWLVCALIVWGADRYRRMLKRLQDEEALRKIAVEELSHRLKNKVATIQSVIRVKLRDQPQTKDAILSLLNSLSVTDDLITATQGKGASIHDIFNAEFRPYDVSRISIQGPGVLLSPKLATTMALVVHELATNSAKYGSLSSPIGKLAINWELSNKKMTIDWRESDGPAVVASTHCGFGTGLLFRALSQFDGGIESKFEPNGLISVMRFILPDETEALAEVGISSPPEVITNCADAEFSPDEEDCFKQSK